MLNRTQLLTRSSHAALMTRRNADAPQSIDLKARTVRLVWSTGADVQRADYEGPFIERLSMQDRAVDLSRLIGAPLLDSHQQRELRNVLGTVTEAGIENGAAWAVVKVSERADVEPIWKDIVANIIRNVSAGYTVQEWELGTDATTGQRTKTAVKWTPIELSLVPVAADPAATTRNDPLENDMKVTATNLPAPNPNVQPGTAAVVVDPNPPAPTNDNRAQINAEIRSIGQLAGLDTAFTDGLIDRSATVDQARAAAFGEMQRRSSMQVNTQRVTVGFSNDDPAVRRERIAEGLAHRMSPGLVTLTDPARPYAHFTIADIATEQLRQRGEPVTGMSRHELITRAITTGDLPLLTQSSVNRVARERYKIAQSPLKALGRQAKAVDFRAKTAVLIDGNLKPETVNEQGEYKSGRLVQGGETYAVKKYGKTLSVTLEALVNDDLGLFNRITMMMTDGATATESDLLAQTILSNPAMSDGKAVFHADHGNLAGAGTALDAENLSVGRKGIRDQTSPAGYPLNLAPKFLLVGSALETDGEKVLAAIQPTTTDDVNPFSGKLTLVVDSRITGKQFYLSADPASIDGFEWAYLEGEEGPHIETRQGWEVDGIDFKCRLIFGAGWIDYRGWHKNPGL